MNDEFAAALGQMGAACHAATEAKPVIYDDEPRNPSVLAKHPGREVICTAEAGVASDLRWNSLLQLPNRQQGFRYLRLSLKPRPRNY
jgi:hypothetical protein